MTQIMTQMIVNVRIAGLTNFEPSNQTTCTTYSTGVDSDWLFGLQQCQEKTLQCAGILISTSPFYIYFSLNASQKMKTSITK